MVGNPSQHVLIAEAGRLCLPKTRSANPTRERRGDHVTISADGWDRESPVGCVAGIIQALDRAGLGKPSPSASADCPAPHEASTHPLVRRGPTPVRLAVPAVARGAGGNGHRAARNMVRTIREDPAGLRDRAILLLGFAGAFRRSGLAALNVADLEFRPEGLP